MISTSRSDVSDASARGVRRLARLALAAGSIGLGACASGPTRTETASPAAPASIAQAAAATAPRPDPRPTLRPGLFDAEEAIWNLRRLSNTPPPREFVGSINSDLAFKGDYAIQGNFNGIQVWDISSPRRPRLVTSYVCPASQSDVSVYGDLLFVSGEGFEGRLDCGTEGSREVVSPDRLRGIRIFDISDVRNPRYVANVQTCRGSHTHTVLEDPSDDENVYIYVSGSAPVRPAEELPGCVGALPEDDPDTALFRIEVIRVPLAAPERAAIVSSPRIFADLVEPPMHGLTPAELAEVEEARGRGAFVLDFPDDQPQVLADEVAANLLDTLVVRRGGTGRPTAADSAALRSLLADMVAQEIERMASRPRLGPTQCHDITVFPAIGLAGGACEGYGFLIDIADPVSPRRIDAVSDENFAYWHSATFNNDGTKILFTDEWGGGSAAKCRDTDPREWGANAIFTIEDRRMRFRSYYKLPAPQAETENCVAHNGSLIPIPGRDVMVQAWYQGGISVFDWTDPSNPVEIAYHDRGATDANRRRMSGPWSVYWYNGLIVSSEISRGLDVFELVASPMLSENEIEAAESVRFEALNAQQQPRFVWPATFALAGAYLDQLERSGALPSSRVASVRQRLEEAQRSQAAARREALRALATELSGEAASSSDASKVRLLAATVGELSTGG
ncbi:MAG TPA: hypothetical protein VLA09_11745 [Longimicrobiales bacterium]|nr:hypothetical protein [Longimicrobiales bacterium]